MFSKKCANISLHNDHDLVASISAPVSHYHKTIRNDSSSKTKSCTHAGWRLIGLKDIIAVHLRAKRKQHLERLSELYRGIPVLSHFFWEGSKNIDHITKFNSVSCLATF